MKLSKRSNYTGFKYSKPEDYIKSVDSDIRNLFVFSEGRIRFGSGGNLEVGENVSGQFASVTCGALTTTEFSIAHGLGSVPVGWIVTSQNNVGDLYSSTGTNSSRIYFKSNTTSTTFTVFLLK